jgi:hypothetical protein
LQVVDPVQVVQVAVVAVAIELQQVFQLHQELQLQ